MNLPDHMPALKDKAAVQASPLQTRSRDGWDVRIWGIHDFQFFTAQKT